MKFKYPDGDVAFCSIPFYPAGHWWSVAGNCDLMGPQTVETELRMTSVKWSGKINRGTGESNSPAFRQDWKEGEDGDSSWTRSGVRVD